MAVNAFVSARASATYVPALLSWCSLSCNCPILSRLWPLANDEQPHRIQTTLFSDRFDVLSKNEESEPTQLYAFRSSRRNQPRKLTVGVPDGI